MNRVRISPLIVIPVILLLVGTHLLLALSAGPAPAATPHGALAALPYGLVAANH